MTEQEANKVVYELADGLYTTILNMHYYHQDMKPREYYSFCIGACQALMKMLLQNVEALEEIEPSQ